MPSSRFYRVTYQEAQALIVLLQAVAKEAPYKEVKAAAKRLLNQLQYVRSDIDYVAGGYQLILNKEDDVNLLNDLAEALEIHIKD